MDKHTEFFNQLTKPHERTLRYMARNLTNNAEKAKDLYQDTMLTVWRKLEKFEPGTNGKAWLMTIMKNTFINDYRKAGVRKENMRCDISTARNVSVAAVAERGLYADDIKNAIGKLSPELMSTFLLECEGYKYNETAKILDIPTGTVKSRVHRAREVLQDVLTPDGRLLDELNVM